MKTKLTSCYTAWIDRGVIPPWHELFSIAVDKQWLTAKIDSLPPDACLAHLRPRLNELFIQCLSHLGSPSNPNVLDTLVIFIRSMLRKHFAGWEVMQIFAGNVEQSDAVFTRFCSAILQVIESETEDESNRSRAIQVGLVFMCSIDQLSPGAYFLRRDFLQGTCQAIRQISDPANPAHGFLFLSSLNNYHRTDAAQLNPYPAQLTALKDHGLFQKALSYYSTEAGQLVSAYQAIVDDRPPTFYATMSSFFGQFKPDKVLTPVTVEAPSAQFADMPPPNAIFLLSMYDLLNYNAMFRAECAEADPSIFNPLLSAFTYIATNAWSATNKRASTYARISLNTLLLLAEDKRTFEMLCTQQANVHICKQRRPFLPDYVGTPRLICSVLDCSALFLRHNLHRDLDVWAYSACLSLVHTTISSLARLNPKDKLDYHWDELWRSLFMTLQFITAKIDELNLLNKGKLLQQLLSVLGRALLSWEKYLEKINSVSQLLFEIIRAEPIFASLPVIEPNRKTVQSRVDFTKIAEYYNEKLRSDKKIRTAEQVMSVITGLVDREGVFGIQGGMLADDEEIVRPADIHTQMGFSRLLYSDGAASVS